MRHRAPTISSISPPPPHHAVTYFKCAENEKFTKAHKVTADCHSRFRFILISLYVAISACGKYNTNSTDFTIYD